MKSVFKVFGIILGVMMMLHLFGCEKPISNKDNDVNANAEVNNIVNKNEPIADVESLDITEEDLINSAVGDNIVFDYYEAVVATVGGNDSEEYVLYTCDYNGYLILIRYETPDGEPEKSYARLVPASTFDDCMKAVKKYKNEVLAILDDKSFLFDTDLLFTTTGILIVERNSLKEICSYDSVDYDVKTKRLTLGSTNYRNNYVDIAKMNEALIDLKHSSAKR